MTVMEDWLLGAARTAALERGRYIDETTMGESSKHHSIYHTGRMPTQGWTQSIWLHFTVLLETLRRANQHSASRSSQARGTHRKAGY